MRPWMIVLIVVLVVLIALIVTLYFLGKRAQKKQNEQQAMLEANKQTVSMLVCPRSSWIRRQSLCAVPSCPSSKPRWGPRSFP